MRHKKIRNSLICIILLCVICGGVYLAIDYSSRVYKQCIAEAGTEVTAEDFLKDTTNDIVFVPQDFSLDTSVPGEYQVTLKSGIFTYHSTVIVQDTIAPQAETSQVNTEYGVELPASAFVTSVQDSTAVTVSYVTKPDFSIPGTQAVELILTDLGGNVLRCEASLTISPIQAELEVEAGGTAPAMREFFVAEDADAELVTDLSTIEMNHVASHEVIFTSGENTYTSVLRVIDTVSPVMTVQDVTAFTSSVLTADAFVVESYDATDLTFSFGEEPDMSMPGTKQVTVVATDEGGNTVTANASLTLEEDTEAPVLSGVSDRIVYLGDSISYKSGVKVTDNCDEDIDFTVDNSLVDLNTEGTYSVTYTAEDRAGNVTSQTINVIVRVREYSIEEVDALADAVLAKIFTDEMTELEKLRAIYTWVRRNVGYINHSDKDDWVKAAYEGLALHQGDCYVFACVSKELLTRAGIANMDIQKIPSRTSHYWNLVDIGEGWYHFDTCPRKQPTDFCYITDAELMEFSDAHSGTHNYDREVYTDIQ